MSIRSTSLLVVGLLAACNYYDWENLDTDFAEESDRDPYFSEAEWAQIQSHAFRPPDPDPTNRYADDPRAAALGHALYFETGFSGSWTTLDSGDDDTSCASCHETEHWFGALTDEQESWRNTPPVVNSAFYTWFLWDGGRDSMWSQSLGPPEQQMNSTRLRVVHMLFEKYRNQYDEVFEPKMPDELADETRFPPEGGPGILTDPHWDDMTPEDQILVNRIYANFGKALAAFQRTLVSGNSRFDQYAGGAFDALTESEKRGLRLFIGEARCSQCHAGPAFTDNEFHNIGVPWSEDPEGRLTAITAVLNDEFNTASMYSDAPNVGLVDGLEAIDEENGKFRTKHLRQIAETGRYMHAGQFATLEAVVDHYDEGGPTKPVRGTLDPLMVPLELTDGDKRDLVAFLYTLTGDPIPANLRVAPP